MEPTNPQSLPFLTRKMLDFEFAKSLSLKVSSQTGTAGTLSITGMTKSGPFSLKHTTNSSGVISSTTFRITDFPIWISVFDPNTSFNLGECFVTLDILIDGDTVFQLASGYLYKQKALSWPAYSSNDKRLGGGIVKTIYGTNPAAGANVFETVPNGREWRLIAARITLATDANVANRRVHLILGDGTTQMIDAFSNTDHAASSTINYTFAAFGYVPASTDANDIVVPIPSNVILPENYEIQTGVTNFQAADNFLAPVFWVEEYVAFS